MELQGQQNSPKCPICFETPVQNIITCIKCRKSYHATCTNATSGEISALTFECQICISNAEDAAAPESVRSASTRPPSRSSNRSNMSQSRHVRLELQRLEEERTLSLAINRDYLNKKYELLHDQEEECHSNASSHRSVSVRNWLKELPNPIHSSNRVPSDPKAIPENINSNETEQQASRLPNTNTHFTNQTNSLNTINASGINVPQNSIHFNNRPMRTTAATMPPSAPAVHTLTAGVPAHIGYQQPQQLQDHSASFLPQAPTTANTTSNNPPVTVNLSATGPCSQSAEQYFNSHPHNHSVLIPPNAAANAASTLINPPVTSSFNNSGPRGQAPQRTFSLNPPSYTALASTQNYARNAAHDFSSSPSQHYENNNHQNHPTYEGQTLSYTTPSNLPSNTASTTQLSQGQLLARKSVPNELPIFTGLPEEWPLFSSTYDWSNNVSGFTDAENLIRLQKSLRGGALKSVQHLLIHPSNVSWVMSILQLMYGQPEKILNSIKNRIKQTPPINENNLPSFTEFAINVRSLIATIEASNLLDEINNSSLLQELLQKLPPSYQLQWGTQKLQLINVNKKPNLYEFSNWVFNIGISASCITVESSTNNKREKNHNLPHSNNSKGYIHTHSEGTYDRNCFVCNNNNCKAIATCQKYVSLNRGDKWNIVRKHKLCKICLFKHSGECRKKSPCGEEGCQYYHHPSLHRYSHEENINNNNNMTVQAKGQNKDVNNTHVAESCEIVNTHSSVAKHVIFKIVPIQIYGKRKIVSTYAFIDEGSSISLMDESLMDDLEMSGTANPLCLKWTGGIERCENSSKKLTIYISGGNNKRIPLNVSTVSAINLPTQTLNYENLSATFRHLRNLPVKSYNNAAPKILIGLNHFNLGIPSKIRQGAFHEPVAIYTQIGWLIYGAVAETTETSKHFNYHICECAKRDQVLDDLVKSFYSLDSVGMCSKDPLISKDDERALSLLNKFTTQRKDGHYETPLLWKFDILNLPDSYEMAMKRLRCLERKLRHNSELLNVFKTTIEKYTSKGYIRKLSREEINIHGKKWYLPIFAVFNRNKPGKSRVVWDAAAKSSGVSLNSFLLKGPDMLASLPAVLFSFRQKSIAVCGDIEEMFHQIFIRPEDRDVQRFLWRDCNQNIEPEVYVMDVMIFGATCAPSISQYIKNVNAAKFETCYPAAVKAIKENHYVDDLLDSVDTPQEAISLISDVKYVHRQGGFNIRNWISNSKEVLNSISESYSYGEKCLNFNEEKQIEKVLGVFWEHKKDVITFKISQWLIESDIFSLRKIPTKREMLRLVMSLYDPLGLIGNIVMYVKILLQDVWRSKIDWDEEISEDLMIKWTRWVNVLPNIQQIQIPRCYLQLLPTYDGVAVQLHTFVDASRDGYAAVCYFRLEKNQTIICSLIGSKTRVAPIKITSVPRLELMAALIGARFAKYICDNHDVEIIEKFFWSDSKTVLSWINSDHRKYNQFVAFRITEILELSSVKDWRYTPTKQNVADEGTKWARIPQISSSSRWFQGPEFLYKPKNYWPGAYVPQETTPEETIHHLFKITYAEKVFDEKRFSKWSRLLRAAAYFCRFINNVKTKMVKKGELTQEELLKAENLLCRQAQMEKYAAEISCLASNTPILKSSEIYIKSPLLDEFGVLRVDGRIDYANVPEERKHPIILSRSNYITNLIILHYHAKYLHTNHETVINELRQKYSISRLRVTFKSLVRNCQWCKIHKAVPHVPQMAKLPRARLASFKAPFSYTGVDFFGPIMVNVNRHKEKRYGCLFTCMTVRAVHIEVAHTLTTSSCILAIRNFMARRGIPLEFFSDNGTNFVGAERELREALADVDHNEFVKTFTSTTTKWNFNPPSSPHMGGAWERLVRSVKTVLYKIMPLRTPDDESLLSMLIEVENVVNSRPLTYVPIDDETDEAVTPNHFLVGSSSGLKPMSACNDSGVVLKQNWLISQQYANIFWTKWVAEYLPTLTCRSKWFEKQKPLCQGDLVVIVDPSLHRNVWPRGKVLETRLAKDGQVRSAKVLTAHGILERPVAKLAVLDVASQKEYPSEEPSCNTAGGNVVATGNAA